MKCRSAKCDGVIVFVATAKAAMPVDAHEVRSGSTERSALVAVPLEVPDGNLVIVGGVCRVKAAGDVGPFYQPHWASCADPGVWRR